MSNYFIGNHVAKCPTYFDSLKNVEQLENFRGWEYFPIQLFTGSNKGWKTRIPSE